MERITTIRWMSWLSEQKGCWVYDVEGKRYLDCLAAYSAVNQGHCHPRILAALIEQAQKVTLTSRAFRNAQLPLLYKDLHDLTGMEMALPMNSGAEAVETAVKAARKWGHTQKGIPDGKAEIIVCAGNFHGRTVTVISFSSDEQYKKGFGPLTPGFRIIPFGDARALREAITPNTCAFLCEPIQGESGIVIPPDGYLREAAAICKENRVLLMVDEIQSGLGRTGKLFAYMHEGDTPGCTDRWQGAGRRFLSSLGSAGVARKSWECSGRAITAARLAAIRWRVPWRERRCGC